MEYLRYGAQRLRESLFLVPAVVIALSVGLAALARYFDRSVGAVADWPFLLAVSVDGGRAIATAVGGATITVAAVVFSITALSSQIAANQFSPRAVAGFFDNRFQQLVIGAVVGTFAYSLLVVAGLAGTIDNGIQRSLSVTLAVVLGIGSGIAIVAYIDHSLRRMRASAVVRRIAEQTVAAVHRAYRDEAIEIPENPSKSEGERIHVWASRIGWVSSIDALRLARALPGHAVARVEVGVGELVAPGDQLATVWILGSSRATAERVVTRFIHTGRSRSIARDPAFGIQQLVEIALRALSPGINDPGTAIEVINHLKLPLRGILLGHPPKRVYPGPEGQRVFLPEAPSRSDHVHASLAPIRLAGAAQPAVAKALLDVCGDLVLELRDKDLEGRTAALVQEATLTFEAARTAGLPEPDVDRLKPAANRLGLDEPDGAA